MPMERLAYRNRFVREIIQQLENYSEADCEGKTPQTISGPDNLVILRVSYDEWVQLYSSLYTGADICYPETSDSVRWILNRAVECPVDLCEVIANAILTCDPVKAALAEVIATDEGIQEALAAAILDSEDIRRAMEIAPGLGAPMGETQLDAPLTPTEDCDLDVVFAQVSGLVDQMNTNNIDFLEIMSVASTPGKRLAQVITAIPVLETLPVDDIVAYVAKLYDEIVANYNAQWTTALRDEYRCGLFCLARDKPDCVLTYDDVFNYINGRLEDAVSVGNLVGSVVQYTLLGTWSGSTVVDIMMLNQIAIWRAAGNWLGVNLRTLQAVTQLSGNIPDSDWIILCEDCPPVYEWEPFLIDGFQPVDTDCGTVSVNEPGHAVFVAGFSYGAYRVQQRLIEPYTCFKITALTYGTLDFPHSTDCDGVQHPGVAPVVDSCYSAIVGADLGPFTITIDFEPC